MKIEHILFSYVFFSKLRIRVSFLLCSHDPTSEPKKIGSCQRPISHTNCKICNMLCTAKDWGDCLASRMQITITNNINNK